MCVLEASSPALAQSSFLRHVRCLFVYSPNLYFKSGQLPLSGVRQFRSEYYKSFNGFVIVAPPCAIITAREKVVPTENRNCHVTCAYFSTYSIRGPVPQHPLTLPLLGAARLQLQQQQQHHQSGRRINFSSKQASARELQLLKSKFAFTVQEGQGQGGCSIGRSTAWRIPCISRPLQVLRCSQIYGLCNGG